MRTRVRIGKKTPARGIGLRQPSGRGVSAANGNDSGHNCQQLGPLGQKRLVLRSLAAR